MQFNFKQKLQAQGFKSVVTYILTIGTTLTAIAKVFTDLRAGELQIPTYLIFALIILVLIFYKFPRLQGWLSQVIQPKNRPMPISQPIFKGELPFVEADQGNFPSRDKEVTECLIAIENSPFLVIDGTSYVGKTSLVKAGILPVIKEKFHPIYISLSKDPLGELYAALLGERYHKSHHSVALRTITKALKDTASDSKPLNEDVSIRRIVLFIDQFERIFDVVQDTQRKNFFSLLKKAIEDYDFRVVTILNTNYIHLLRNACREVDPEEVVLYVGKYYSIKPFSLVQAVAVLEQMLRPLCRDELHLVTHYEDFSQAFVKILARPSSSNKRHLVVYPIELQILGYVLQSFSPNQFSIDDLNRTEGRKGLFKIYLEEVRGFVKRTTGEDCSTTMRVLRRLANIKEEITDLSSERVESILEALKKKGIVKKVPPPSPNTTDSKKSFLGYQLLFRDWGEILLQENNLQQSKTNVLLQQIRRRRKYMLVKKWTAVGLAIMLTFHLLRLSWINSDSYQLTTAMNNAPIREAYSTGKGAKPVADFMEALGLAGNSKSFYSHIASLNEGMERGSAYASFAKGLIASGNTQRAQAFLTDALSESRLFSTEPNKSELLGRISFLMAKIERLDEASNIASEIVTPHEQAKAYLKIASLKTQNGRLIEAQKFFFLADNSVLINQEQEIVNSFPTAVGGPHEIATHSDVDFFAIHETENDNAYINKLFTLAKKYQKSRQPKMATLMMNKMDQFSREVGYEEEKNSLLQLLALKHAQDGDFDKAIETLLEISHGDKQCQVMSKIAEQALKRNYISFITKRIHNLQNNYMKARLLASEAKGVLQAGGKVDAPRILNESLELLETFKDESAPPHALKSLSEHDFSRTRILPLIVEYYIVDNNADMAIKIAEEIKDNSIAARVFANISIGLIQAGDLDRAGIYLLRAISLKSGSHFNEEIYYEAMLTLTKAHIDTHSAGKVIELARSIEVPADREQSQCAVVEGLASANAVEEAVQVLEEIGSLAMKSRAYFCITKMLAASGLFLKANFYAEKCSSPIDKLDCYTAIVTTAAKKSTQVKAQPKQREFELK